MHPRPPPLAPFFIRNASGLPNGCVLMYCVIIIYDPTIEGWSVLHDKDKPFFLHKVTKHERLRIIL